MKGQVDVILSFDFFTTLKTHLYNFVNCVILSTPFITRLLGHRHRSFVTVLTNYFSNNV